jgi:hypothetical protein
MRLPSLFLACLSVAVAAAGEREGWTAETPDGSQTAGRTVEMRDGRVFVNDAPISLRGVTAPATPMSVDEREALLIRWKQANANALLVPSNANPADWLPLCDRLGLYVVTASEVGGQVPQPASSKNGLRSPENAQRDLRVHPSYLLSLDEVVAISNPATMQAFLKLGARPGALDRPTLVNVTLDVPADRPIIAIDLVPAPGDLPMIWQEIYWHPCLLGAFLAASVDATTAEVKKVYQPILIERRRLRPGDVAVRITNRHHHLSLDVYEARWAVRRGDEVIQHGVLPPLALAPNAQPEVPLPVAPIDTPVPGAAYTLCLSFHTRSAGAWAPAGHEIAYEELLLDVAVPAPSSE